MNAPKEYYPVGYEKNFDDNFTTKVDLPPTTFHCGDQKHFPGLYGDVELGCMVRNANRLHLFDIFHDQKLFFSFTGSEGIWKLSIFFQCI